MFAVYDVATGGLRSITSTVPGTLPEGMASVDVGEPPAEGWGIWNPATLTFAARPAPIPVEQQFETFWASTLQPFLEAQTQYGNMTNAEQRMARLIGKLVGYSIITLLRVPDVG